MREKFSLNWALLANICRKTMQPVQRQVCTQAISAVWREVKTGAKCRGPTDEGIPKATPGTVYVTIPGWTASSLLLHDTIRLWKKARTHARMYKRMHLCTDAQTHAHVPL